MKNLLLKNWVLTIIFFLSQYMANGQWIEQNSGTSENLNEVQFTSDIVGYIVGDNGTLLKTIDGGENWNSLPSGTSQDLVSLWFLDNEVGFIGGETGFASKTEDGGNTWQSLNLSLSNPVEFYFMNNDIGFIGTKNQIFRTIDNGENWDETELINEPFFSSVYEFGFATDLIGYVVNGLALKTEDGGQTWTYIVDSSHPDYNDANILTSCEALEDIVYFGSTYYQGLYSTTDGGTSLDFEPKVIDAIDFPSSSVGYAIQRTNDNHIIKTIDEGGTWDLIFTETDVLRLNDIHFVDENRGWVVAWDGLILHTKNGGTLTSIEENNDTENSNLIQVYPNPTRDALNLKIPANLTVHSIKLLDAQGKTLLELDKNTTQFNIKNYANGVYVIALNTNKGLLTRKINITQ